MSSDGLVPVGDGSTPLHPDDRRGLRPSYITTRRELNEAERRNVLKARRKYLQPPPATGEILQDLWLRRLHKEMFGDVWEWAGTYRLREMNIGVPPPQIAFHVRALTGNVKAWLDSGRDEDECALDMHRRLGEVHPFTNGNGRHARLAADLLAVSLGNDVFTWGSTKPNALARDEYLKAVRRADRGDISDLVEFARS